MPDTPATSTNKIMERVLQILNVPEIDREKMIGEVNALIEVDVLRQLLVNLASEDQKRALDLLQNKPQTLVEAQQLVIQIRDFIQAKSNSEDRQTATEKALQEVLPAYLNSITQFMNPDQKENLRQLAREIAPVA